MPLALPAARQLRRAPARSWRLLPLESQPRLPSQRCNKKKKSSAQRLVALQRRRKAAVLFRGIALEKLLFGDHRIVFATISQRSNHRPCRTFTCPFHETAQLALARNQNFPPGRKIVAVIKRVAARIDKDRAGAIAPAAGKGDK